MTRSAGRLASDTLHGATIAKEAICVVAEEVITWLVEDSSGVCLRNCEADCVTESLAKWASCDFNAFCVMALRMTRGDAVNAL